MSDLPSRETVDGYSSVDFEEQQAVLDAYVSGRLVDREAMVKGVVTATGDNTMLGHGEPGPWAYVTVHGDYEVSDTVLVAALGVKT